MPGRGASGTIIMIALGAFLVFIVVVLVLLSNPPTKWVDRISPDRKNDTTSGKRP